MKKSVLLFSLILLMNIGVNSIYSEDAHYNILKERLVKEGFKSDFLDKIYSHKDSVYMSNIITINVKRHENRLDYDQFHNDSNLEKSKKYMHEYKTFLDETYTKYGIPSEYIVSILMVETRLGKYRGRHRVINVLSSMSISDTDEAIDSIYTKYLEDNLLEKKERLTRNQVAEKVKTRSNWAYKELKVFLTYIDQQKLDPYEIYGSISGAFGYAQFIPSSVIHYAQDGNGDGVIDLFNHYDAMASVANYLRENGWKTKAVNNDGIKKVIQTYNHSKYYVNAVYQSANKLKKIDND